ncbi:MAG: hypothetical protein ACE5LV_04755 [Candidatus Aminicenantales bacterium]
MRWRWVFLLLGILGLLGCMSPEARQVKLYEQGLQAMLGDATGDVIEALKGWEFGLLDSWEGRNPSEDEIAKHNRPAGGFSKEEAASLFAEEGTYKVMLFIKKVGTDVASTGQIDGIGMTYAKDADYTAERYTLIRVLFRDESLVHYRVWPSVSRSRLSGIKVDRRG